MAKRRSQEPSFATRDVGSEPPEGPLIPLAEGLACITGELSECQALIEHTRFREGLQLGHFTLHGTCEASEHGAGTGISASYFREPFVLDLEGNLLRPVEPIGYRSIYRDLSINPDTLEFLRLEFERIRFQEIQQNLFRRVEEFELTPEEANDEGVRLGIGQLNPFPIPAEFDPLMELRWTFAMALAWIIWRDPDQVREQWDKWRAKVSVWQCHTLPHRQPDGSIHASKRMCLVSLTPRHGSCSLVKDSVPDGLEPHSELHDARAALWSELQDGKLDPDGLHPMTSRRERIPARRFIDLALYQSSRGEDYLSSDFGGVTYYKPTLSSADVIARWPVVNRTGEKEAAARRNPRKRPGPDSDRPWIEKYAKLTFAPDGARPDGMSKAEYRNKIREAMKQDKAAKAANHRVPSPYTFRKHGF